MRTVILITAILGVTALVRISPPSAAQAPLTGVTCHPGILPPPGSTGAGLIATLTADRTTYPAGEPAAFTITVTNTTDTPVTTGGTGLLAVLSVRTATGDVVWMYPSIAYPLPPPGNCIFAPGASVSRTIVWNQRRSVQLEGRLIDGAPVAPGVYTVRGGLTTGPSPDALSISIQEAMAPSVEIPGNATLQQGESVTFRRPADGATLTILNTLPQSVTLRHDGAALLILTAISGELWLSPAAPGDPYQRPVCSPDVAARRCDAQPTVAGANGLLVAVTSPPYCPGSGIARVTGPGQVAPCPSSPPVLPPITAPIPGSVSIPPGGAVTFTTPLQNPAPGEPVSRGGSAVVEVRNESGMTANAVYDGAVLTISLPEARRLRITSPSATACVVGADRIQVGHCATSGRPPALFVFTAVADSPQEAALVLGDPRPCIPNPGERACDATRLALWNGEAATWAAHGVTDPDARFRETVIFRVRAGDPAAIGAIARILGAPYLKVTRVHFAGETEFAEITNLGGGAQEMTGWTLRPPARNAAFSFPSGFVLQPGQSQRVCSRCISPCPRGPLMLPCNPDAFTFSYRLGDDIFPDAGSEVTLFYDALALTGDDTYYSADPLNQPPPPNLQLISAP